MPAEPQPRRVAISQTAASIRMHGPTGLRLVFFTKRKGPCLAESCRRWHEAGRQQMSTGSQTAGRWPRHSSVLVAPRCALRRRHRLRTCSARGHSRHRAVLRARAASVLGRYACTDGLDMESELISSIAQARQGAGRKGRAGPWHRERMLGYQQTLHQRAQHPSVARSVAARAQAGPTKESELISSVTRARQGVAGVVYHGSFSPKVE